MSRFAVVACTPCKQAWTVELRHARVSCPACRKSVELTKRTRLWEGDDARDARSAAASLRAALAQNVPVEVANQRLRESDPRPVPRHDSPVDAAASKGSVHVNKSARAEEVALWLTRLLGSASHDAYLEALGKAGIDAERAEKEITRMLARDVIYEPRAGCYASLST